jgi:hypothetical protein
MKSPTISSFKTLYVLLGAFIILGSHNLPAANILAELTNGTLKLLPQMKTAHPRLLLTADELQERRKEYQQDPSFVDNFFLDESVLGGKGFSFSSEETAPGNSIMLARVALGYVITKRPDLLKRLRGGLSALGDLKSIHAKSMGNGNSDLNVGTLLFGLSFTYDLLKPEFKDDEIALLRKCIIDQSETFFTDVQN